MNTHARTLVWIALAVLASCSGKEQPAAAGSQYLGTAECTGCHQEIAATFAGTGMGRSWYPLTQASAVEDFTDKNEIEIDRDRGLRYRLSERDGKFFMRQFVLDSTGSEMAVDEREMIWVTGSGNHSRSYVTIEDGHLFQMPVCWYPEKKIWDLCPGYEKKNDHFAREITDSCVFCHNGWMELIPGERSRYKEPIPHGIGCERCHGPGSAHVARWRAGNDEPTGKGDPTIVNPERLPRDTRIQVCFQCHLGDSKATERVERYGKTARDYRPGAPLTDALMPFHFAEGNPSEFGISAQADRLVRSRCYLASQGKLECLTCHDPHVTVYGGSRDAAFFRARCLECHTTASCAAPAPARAATRKLADDCVACHMPRGEPDDHAHTTFTDHWIRVVTPPAATPVSRSIALVPVFPAAAESLPKAELTYERGRAYFLKSLDFPEAVRRRMWEAAEGSFREAAAAGFAEGEASFYLGKTLQYERRWDEAVDAFRRAVAKNPEYKDAVIALGTALLQAGRKDEAAQVLQRAVETWPREAGVLAELARAEAAAGRDAAAADLFGRAAAIEPWKAALHLNRAILAASLRRDQEAVAGCDAALRLEPSDPAVFAACGGILRAAGEGARAAEVERRARLLTPPAGLRPDSGKQPM